MDNKPIQEQEESKEDLDSFFAVDRNYIILTNSGKPIFSAHGDMYNLSSVYATLYAMASKVSTYRFKPIDLAQKQSQMEDFTSLL